MKKVVIITGCLGFIGGYVTRECLSNGWEVMGIDSETYAANKDLLIEFNTFKNFTYLNKNINDLNMIYDCDYIINLAAETHVDNSIEGSNQFVHSNISGVFNLLNLIIRKPKYARPLFVHFSTDEVYGDILEGSFDEKSIMNPSNPYSATKASADMLILAWNRTFQLPYLIVRPSNNYGVGQYIEKFIPKTCKYLNLEKKVPLHEHGTPKRTWLHVTDTVNAVMTLLEQNKVNEIYNISGNYEDSNLNVFKKILTNLNIDPADYKSYVDFEVQRLGQDVRYSINDNKLKNLGWNNKKEFDNELFNIVNYYNQKFIW